jgi:anti-sigma B factor antagonist
MGLELLAIEELSDSGKGFRILRLKGPILVSNLFEFQAMVRSNTSPGLILDLTDVPYIDSAGVGALVGAYVKHQKDGRSLGLVGASDRIRNTLRITQVESFFRYFDSAAAAQNAA